MDRSFCLWVCLMRGPLTGWISSCPRTSSDPQGAQGISVVNRWGFVPSIGRCPASQPGLVFFWSVQHLDAVIGNGRSNRLASLKRPRDEVILTLHSFTFLTVPPPCSICHILVSNIYIYINYIMYCTRMYPLRRYLVVNNDAIGYTVWHHITLFYYILSYIHLLASSKSTLTLADRSWKIGFH